MTRAVIDPLSQSDKAKAEQLNHCAAFKGRGAWLTKEGGKWVVYRVARESKRDHNGKVIQGHKTQCIEQASLESLQGTALGAEMAHVAREFDSFSACNSIP